MRVGVTWPSHPGTAGRLAASGLWPRRPATAAESTTVLAALTLEGLQASMIVEGAANTEVFLTYLDEVLCPALQPGQTVVMDNLGRAPGCRGARTHRSPGVPVGVPALL
jgi:hypothetical protein